MAQTVVMPRFGATMEEGTINSWSVQEGDAVSKGDVLCEIAIEKLANELLAEEDGVVLKILADEGATLPCGEPIIILGAAGETLAAEATSVQVGQVEKAAAAQVSTPVANLVEAPVAQKAEYSASAQITPKALELAEELGVDYHYVTGTGRFGMVSRDDIRAAAAAGTAQKGNSQPVSPQPVNETSKMTSMQLTIAKAMENSLKSTAQTTISMDVDASSLVRSYQAHKEEYNRQGAKLTYTVLLIKLVALALNEHKLLRTVIEDTNLVTHGEINIGIAIDVADGLIVPNIKNAHQKSLRQIAAELADLANRAKNNTLTLDQISGGTFTITNLGSFGIKYFTPVLNPGESAILGVGTLQEIPYIHEGGIFVKPVMNLSLTHDHRIVNGAPGARFLQTIQQLMNTCETLFEA